MKRSLALRYTLHQMTYRAIAADIVSFATACLLGLTCLRSLVCAVSSLVFGVVYSRLGGNRMIWASLGRLRDDHGTAVLF